MYQLFTFSTSDFKKHELGTRDPSLTFAQLHETEEFSDRLPDEQRAEAISDQTPATRRPPTNQWSTRPARLQIPRCPTSLPADARSAAIWVFATCEMTTSEILNRNAKTLVASSIEKLLTSCTELPPNSNSCYQTTTEFFELLIDRIYWLLILWNWGFVVELLLILWSIGLL